MDAHREAPFRRQPELSQSPASGRRVLKCDPAHQISTPGVLICEA